jgi:SAM-dependent methyltransferase
MKLADALSLRSRRRKLRLFLEEMDAGPTSTVVDVGVDEISFGQEGGQTGCATHNFFEELYPWPSCITAVGLHEGEGFRQRYPDVEYVQADACALPFADGAFDLYFSNAVIEHVGDRERQRQLIAEALRVAQRVFVTTPNRWFPIEIHTRLPLVHWLPERAAASAYRLAGRSWAAENHLLGPADLRSLFPVPVRVVNLGVTLVAIT